MRKSRFLTILLTLFFFVSSAIAANAAPKDNTQNPDAGVSSASVEQLGDAARQAVEPLTREEMLSAIPMPIPVVASDAIAKSDSSAAESRKSENPETATLPIGPATTGDFQTQANYTGKIGKVFVRSKSGGVVFTCSGSAINNAGKNMVLTAGHCVYGGGNFYIGANYNWFFVPGYQNGNAPYGQWQAKTIATNNAWINKSNFNFDVGIALMFPLNNTQLVTRVGGLGLQWGLPAIGDRTAIGYPAEGRFNGENQYFCFGKTRAYDTGQVEMSCDMTRGSSGGPWIIGLNVSDGIANGAVSNIDRIVNPTVSRSAYFSSTSIGTLWNNYQGG